MKRYILSTIIIVTLLAACSPVVAQSNPDVNKVEVQPTDSIGRLVTTSDPAKKVNLGDAVIIYSRSGGFAGVNEKWTIYPDGRIVPISGAERKVEAAQITTLVQEIESLGFFEMKESYGGLSQCNDCFTFEITVSSGDQVKTITTIEGNTEIPADFWTINKKILDLLQPTQ